MHVADRSLGHGWPGTPRTEARRGFEAWRTRMTPRRRTAVATTMPLAAWKAWSVARAALGVPTATTAAAGGCRRLRATGLRLSAQAKGALLRALVAAAAAARSL